MEEWSRRVSSAFWTLSKLLLVSIINHKRPFSLDDSLVFLLSKKLEVRIFHSWSSKKAKWKTWFTNYQSSRFALKKYCWLKLISWINSFTRSKLDKQDIRQKWQFFLDYRNLFFIQPTHSILFPKYFANQTFQNDISK